MAQAGYLNLPPHPLAAVPRPSPLLHALAIVILILTVLGFASTIVTLPFDLLPLAKPDPAKSSASLKPASSKSVKVPNPIPHIGLGTWMTFFLVMCLLLVALQDLLGYGSSPSRQTGIVTTPQTALTMSTIASQYSLESAFYPLVIGAILLLIIFDYAS